MKIITWNCQGAFRKKAEFIVTHKPDILIIPECEHPDKLKFKSDIQLPSDSVWFGKNPNKGLGVFSYNGYKLKLLDIHNPDFKFVLPLSVSNDKISLTLFAIWSQKPENHDNYTVQVWNAVNYYTDLLEEKNLVLAGDFNSNSIWDKPRRVSNHSNLVEYLKNKNISSAYHFYHKQTQGQEKDKTLFMQRNKDRPYHIDYCFASADLIDRIENVEIGSYDQWTTHSDHSPLSIKFDL